MLSSDAGRRQLHSRPVVLAAAAVFEMELLALPLAIFRGDDF